MTKLSPGLILLFASILIQQLNLSVYAGQLAIGSESRVAAEQNIPLYAASDLNFKSRLDILAMRRRILELSPLYVGTYSPNDYVFGQIEDKKPWWGLFGRYVYRVGQQSILGPAKESRYLYNPYLLVAAESKNIGLVDPDKVNEKVLSQPGFPFVWVPQNLKWNPKQCSASVTYNVSEFQNKITEFQKYLTGNYRISKFSLIAYNARDLGFKYMYADLSKSKNITCDLNERRPVELKQMIHCGSSCGYPGGCNNMSPLMAEMEFFKIKNLPATLNIYLWKNLPSSVAEKPDFKYSIFFK